MVTYNRDTHSEAQRGVAAYTKNLTWVGSGGIDTSVVDGNIVMLAYHHTAAGTDSSTAMHSIGATATHYGAMPKAGSVVGWNWHVTAALTGTETVKFLLKIGATASTVVATGVTTASSGYATFAKDRVPFAAGKKLSVFYTCTHWGAAHNMQANLLVEM